MTTDAQALLQSWSAPLGVNVSLCLTALVYSKGWFRLHAAFPNLISVGRLAAFLAGTLFGVDRHWVSAGGV